MGEVGFESKGRKRFQKKWKSGCPTTLKQGGDSKGTDRNRNDLSIQALKRWFYA